MVCFFLQLSVDNFINLFHYFEMFCNWFCVAYIFSVQAEFPIKTIFVQESHYDGESCKKKQILKNIG